MAWWSFRANRPNRLRGLPARCWKLTRLRGGSSTRSSGSHPTRLSLRRNHDSRRVTDGQIHAEAVCLETESSNEASALPSESNELGTVEQRPVPPELRPVSLELRNSTHRFPATSSRNV